MWQSRHVGVAVSENCVVWELQCVGVAVCGSCGVGELRCGDRKSTRLSSSHRSVARMKSTE